MSKIKKSDYIRHWECPKNAWLKIHKPDIFNSFELSDFEQGLLETGNEVDKLARQYFPGGTAFNIGDADGSRKAIEARVPVLYQPVFETEKYLAICDILVLNEKTEKYDLYEVKASTSKKEEHTYDIGFQKQVLIENSVPLGDTFLLLVNKEYVFNGTLDVREFFVPLPVADVPENIVSGMEDAYRFLASMEDPGDGCSCLHKSRTNHCLTFGYSNPGVPEYSVHDIARIRSNKVRELVDLGVVAIEKVPPDFSLSDRQKTQVEAARSKKEFVDEEEIATFLEPVRYPLAFLDYETCPLAVPRFDGYCPYDQVPFQFSLHILHEDGSLEHKEFLHTEDSVPDISFLDALEDGLPDTGSIMVWYKSFETGVNKNLARRNPQYAEYIEGIEERIIDLMLPFKNLHWTHPDFKGKTSIKYVLPALVPSLSYHDLDIQDGAAAAETWKQITQGDASTSEKNAKKHDLLDYCKLDTEAMYHIYKKMECYRLGGSLGNKLLMVY